MSTPVGPRTTVEPDPADRGSWWTYYWIGWIALFFVGEIPALIVEAKKAAAGLPDKVKRTLSANVRWWAAYNSATGIPTNAKYGKLRRLALAILIMWFSRHISREGEM